MINTSNLKSFIEFIINSYFESKSKINEPLIPGKIIAHIAIEPVKSVEFIYIPLRIKNTGEIAKLGN